ncbi:hypothetical protein SeMB42_g07777 [Synchytrium endobioticum]|uniref:Uncharacterized protein n=1 Tax=Synchytrium endobioticum TaxID=286115 RepID=A0A507BW25_9FUNG|nr:hypothetical protein SeMB42_g07777 [Synchytrium endobioticum]
MKRVLASRIIYIVKMGKNVMIVTVTALMAFFTLIQSAPGQTIEELIKTSIKKIAGCRAYWQNDMNNIATDNERSHYRGTTTRHCLGKDFNARFSILQKPTEWIWRLTYDELIELPNTDRRWVPVCIAHEELIIDRANHDMERLLEYRKFIFGKFGRKVKAEDHLRLYQHFIDLHKHRITAYEEGGTVGPSDPMVALTAYIAKLPQESPALVGTGVPPMVTSTDQVDAPIPNLLARVGRYEKSDPMETSTNYVDRPVPNLLARVGRYEKSDPMETSTNYVYRRTLDLLGRGGIDGTSNPMETSTNYVYRRTLDLLGRGGIDGTSNPMETSTNYVYRRTLDLLGRGGIDGTSTPMETSTNYVYRRTLDLLGRGGIDGTSNPMVASTDYVDWPTPNSNAPTLVEYDFFGQPEGQGLGSSLGTHDTEEYYAPTPRFEAPPPALSSDYHLAAESSTHSHNDRNRGKMPMYDGGPPT